MRISQIVHRSQPAVLGLPTLLELGFPREGTIFEISVRQVGGTSVAFTADVYNARRAVTPGVSSGGDPTITTDDLGDPALYRVVPQISGTSGNVGQFADSTGVPFRNLDGGWTRAEGKIYVVLTPGSSGGDQSATWDVSFKVATPPSY